MISAQTNKSELLMGNTAGVIRAWDVRPKEEGV